MKDDDRRHDLSWISYIAAITIGTFTFSMTELWLLGIIVGAVMFVAVRHFGSKLARRTRNKNDNGESQ